MRQSISNYQGIFQLKFVLCGPDEAIYLKMVGQPCVLTAVLFVA